MNKMPITEKIRLMIVEDHHLVREGMVALLRMDSEIDIVAVCDNGDKAVADYGEHRPDITLMDLQMPGMGGVEAIRAIRELHAAARVIVLTTYEGDEDVFRALQAGARAYLLKGMPLAELATTIRRVHQGKMHIPGAIAEKLAERISGRELTGRELAVLERIVAGRSNKQIGYDLFISETTVKTHVNAILTKLSATDRTHAATIAIQRGLVPLR